MSEYFYSDTKETLRMRSLRRFHPTPNFFTVYCLTGCACHGKTAGLTVTAECISFSRSKSLWILWDVLTEKSSG